MSDLIIIQHNDLAVNMTDDCQYEHLLIDHYIKMVLQKCQQEPKESDIIRLPFNIYAYSRNIFKQENQIIRYIIKRITEIFYLKEFTPENNTSSDEMTRQYLKLIFSAKGNKVLVLSQIIVRMVLLALSIRIGQKDLKTFKFKFKRLIQNLKIQLILSPQSISDLIIKELQYMGECFQSVQYYEQLKAIFEKLQVNKVVRWLESMMEKKKSNYQGKTQATLPYKKEAKNKILQKQTVVTSQPANSTHSKAVEQPEVVQVKCVSQNKLEKTEKRTNSPQKQRRMSTIILANKLRKSVGVPSTRFSSKYTFKSTKKQSQEDIIVYQEEIQIECTSIQQNQSSVYQKRSQIPNRVNFKNQQQDTNLILCPATPPKNKIKFIHD